MYFSLNDYGMYKTLTLAERISIIVIVYSHLKLYNIWEKRRLSYLILYGASTWHTNIKLRDEMLFKK